MVRDPGSLDVVVASNLFADILTDLAAAIQGGMGTAASANLAPGSTTPGLFEPVHGSAPDIAGRGIANPAAMLRSTALMLEYAFGRSDHAHALEAAVDAALVSSPTPDLGGHATTTEFADAVAGALS
jgi:isocitrate/isopropylmalate dehydrogenase